MVCPTSIANAAVAEYGAAPSSPSSPVGQTGGSAVAGGLPVPILSINNVFAPSATQVHLHNKRGLFSDPEYRDLPVHYKSL